MANAADAPADRSTLRKIATAICLLAVGGLFLGVARQSWAASTDDQAVVNLEADGAEMMHPMTSLLSELVMAQSAAVRGEPLDNEKLRSAIDAVTEPDGEYGAALSTTDRLDNLRAQVESAVASGVTGEQAYAIWSSIVDLCVDLIHVIGDTSQLVHDPDLDAYYLMDGAIVRLPRAMVYAGRAADLVALADGEQLAGEALVQAAVARFNVSLDAEQVLTGLTTSVDFTERSELGTNIAPRLDTFRSAADDFAPPTMLQELATEVDAATIADSASRVFAAAASLSHLLLGELQALLQIRTEEIEQQRRATIASSAAAGLLGLAIAWLVLAARRPRPAPVDEPTPVSPAPGAAGDLAGAGARRGGHAR